MHAMRRLPLRVGYKQTISIFSTLGGGVSIPIGLEVVAKEAVQTPVGKFDCFKVVLSVNQTFWFSDDAHRYLVKMEIPGATALLTSVSQRKLGEPVPFSDQALGVSVTAPAGWVIHKRSNGSAEGETAIYFLDPEAILETGLLRLVESAKLPALAGQSARAWLEMELKETFGQRLKDVKVRSESWKTENIAGRLVTSCVADYVERDRPMVLLCSALQGPKNSEQFAFALPADQLAALKPAVDSIIASYRAK
jgi:hypothetical protein